MTSDERTMNKGIPLVLQNQIPLIIVWGFALAVGVISWQLLPHGGLDMRDDILPSLRNWRAPWVEGVPLFPWATFVLMPLRIFSPRFATALINGLSTILLALTIKKLNGNILFAIPIMVSPIGISLLSNGQTDAIVLASILLPPGLDLLLFWKPQVIAHAFWVRVRGRLKLYLISGLTLLLISFIIWGFWPMEIFHFAQVNLINGWWNRSLWPYSIPFGLFLIYFSIKKNDVGYGLMASPLLFPYVTTASYIGLLVVIASKWPKLFGLIYLLYLAYILFIVFHQ